MDYEEPSIAGTFADSFNLAGGADTANALAAWIQTPMAEDLRTLPRVGAVTAQCFRNVGINTTFALLGKFLTFKDAGATSIEHVECFWIWLTEVFQNNRIIKRDRAVICRAICMRAALLIPGIYDEEAYESL